MADYISRETAVKIAERYGLTHGSVLGRHSGIADCIASEIESVPSADVVEVTRCGKCKYKRDTLYCRLRETPVIVSNADFCSFGKPKSETEGDGSN